MNINLKSYNDNQTIDYYSYFDGYGLFSFESKIIKEYFIGKKILDVGCGTGRTTYPLHLLGYDVVGIDYSEGMIARAKEIYPMINFEIGNCAEMIYKDNSFDNALFSFNGIVLESSYDIRKKMFEEIYRVLLPGGVFFFTTPYLDNKVEREYWKEKAKKEGLDISNKRDRMLLGDQVTDEDGVEFFLHVPFCEEIEEIINRVGFSFICRGSRLKDFGEEKAEEELDDNYYWVVRK
jgi:SAM-dependent methyltransferase